MQNALADALQGMPIIAILRGVKPDEARAVAGAIYSAGVNVVEVPLNSPSALLSIQRIAGDLPPGCWVGAGTVLTTAQVDAVKSAGGRLVVSPNTDPDVIRHAVAEGVEAFPGFLTPSEMFAAVQAGARRLKLFPASVLGAAGLKATLAVCPDGVEIYAVGGVGAGNARDWLSAGAAGLGVGSDIYSVNDTPEDVYAKTRVLIAAIESI